MHNLDDGLKEYFEFTTGGHTYHFSNPTVDEWKHISEVAKGEDKEAVAGEIGKLVSSVGDAPPFEEVYKKFRLSQIKNFNKMLDEEFADLLK
jgi:hypothetical protein